MRKVWIEAALNGSWSRARQPGIPDTVEAIIAEGVACARAGATIVHVHAYDGGGPQTFDWQVYARIIEGIRNEADVPVYPSYPGFIITGGEDSPFADVAARFAGLEELAARGLLDFAVIDPGSVNLSLTKVPPDTQPAGTYLNPESQIRYALNFAARHGLHTDFAIYEPGFVRAGAALARMAGAKVPIYRLMFCNLIAVGLPPKPYALAAYHALLVRSFY
jgi:3-keto-5-aminohexanoate cleavage enzyme